MKRACALCGKKNAGKCILVVNSKTRRVCMPCLLKRIDQGRT